MTDDKKAIPGTHALHSITELLTMAVHATLRAQGVDDPKVFLRENHVDYSATYDNKVGAAGIYIKSVTPLVVVESTKPEDR